MTNGKLTREGAKSMLSAKCVQGLSGHPRMARCAQLLAWPALCGERNRSASFESMQATLEAMRGEWGSVNGYLDSIGVTASVRDALRRQYLALSSQL